MEKEQLTRLTMARQKCKTAIAALDKMREHLREVGKVYLLECLPVMARNELVLMLQTIEECMEQENRAGHTAGRPK